MRNILLFIRRFFNFFLFLVLQVFAILVLAKYNKTHQAVFDSIANETTGWISSKYNNVEYYFHLSETNKALSEKRARAVADYLISTYNMPRNRFIIVGNGPDKPVGSNDTEEGKSKNRRTDFEIVGE